MLVDDDPGLLRLLSMRVQAAGYEPVCALSGEEALAQLPANRPSVVVTDLQMGGMDGLALFNEIHQDNPSLPVIILTAHGTIPDAVTATSQGVFGFLTKPFDSKHLLDLINKAAAIGGNVVDADDSSEEHVWCEEIVTRNPDMKELLSQARLIANSDANVFLSGEGGTGKELLARAIHKASPRNDKPFVTINCSAIPEQLMESELFGHKKGAFTGANDDYDGLMRAAHGGTLFIDEVGDMPLGFQSKLLRVLQEGQLRAVGNVEPTPVDVRLISATPRNLQQDAAAGEFREELFYRLNVATLEILSLEDRREDIPLLANHFLEKLADIDKKSVKGFAPDAMEILVSASWPGNVRQLYNVVEQAVLLATTPIIPVPLIQRALCNKEAEIVPFAEARARFERDYLARVLRITNGNVTQAARLAQRNRTEFYKLLNKHHLAPSVFKQ
ncbi:sigma 54-interacting transcriptional regulator [Pseudomonadota bacterium]